MEKDQSISDDHIRVVINLHEDAPERDVIHDHLRQFNLKKTAAVRTPADFQSVTISLRNRSNDIVGGIYGDIFLGSLMIKILWVSEAYRGRDLGTRLVHLAEEQARKFECHTMQLDTFSFQAPEFYKRLGFEEFGCIEHGRDIKHHYFRKALNGVKS